MKSKSKSSFLISTSILASARRVGVGGGVGGDDGWFIGACNRGTARIANDRRNEWIIGSLNRTWWPSVPANEDSGPIESIAFPMRLNWLYLVKPYWTTYMRSRPLNRKLKKNTNSQPVNVGIRWTRQRRWWNGRSGKKRLRSTTTETAPLSIATR